MDKYYYELKISIEENFRNLFLEFLIEIMEDAIEEVKEGFILRSFEPLDDTIWALTHFKDELEKNFNKQIVLTLEQSKKENQDWIEKYKKSVEPIEVGRFYIRPSWHQSSQNKNLIDIVIDPALAFGSGHHESTNSCLKAISSHIKENSKITALDVGCGSGILGIGAAKLGANVEICDTDPLSIEESIKNFKQNSVTLHNSWIGSCNATDKKYDFVIANIIADILIILEKELKARVGDGGYLLMSGILDKHKDRVKNRFKDLKLIEEINTKEWCTLLFKKD